MSYSAFSVNNNGSVPIQQEVNPNERDGKVVSDMIGCHIHRGGVSWNWSKGCLTMFDPTGDSWARLMSNFPENYKTISFGPDTQWKEVIGGLSDGLYLGKLSIMSF